jgi:tetratricopeptide (TPR) repeat protein
MAKPPMVLYLNGDGKGGFPAFDGTLLPMQAGMSVEVLPKTVGAPDDVLRELTKALKETRNLAPRGEITTEKITLSDGTDALLLSSEFDRLDKGRLSFSIKVISATSDGRVLIATGWITCGKACGTFVRQSGLVNVLKAYIVSLVHDTEKIDAKGVETAVAKMEQTLSQAIAKAESANELIGTDDERAAKLFREALALSDLLPVAHNGLAWILVTSEDNNLINLPEGLTHAKRAVDLTEGRDYAALDTLAVAIHKGGNTEEAIRTIKKAIELMPRDKDLQARLMEFESAKSKQGKEKMP